MSTDSLAALRKNFSDDLRNLAEQHIQHDLEPSDRDALKSAASRLTTHTTIGTLFGLGVGVALAWRIRSYRIKMFEAFKAAQKPTHVKFANGREEPIPDITPLFAPTRAGDIATYAFFGIAGLFLGGETGLLTGALSARRTIEKDPLRKERVEKAMKYFRIDVLKKEIETLERDKGSTSQI